MVYFDHREYAAVAVTEISEAEVSIQDSAADTKCPGRPALFLKFTCLVEKNV
jgi:hypothetical protein